MQLYRRKNSSKWFVDFVGPDGKRVRTSTGCTNKIAAKIEGERLEIEARDPDSTRVRAETVESCLTRLIEQTSNVATKRFYTQKSGHLCGILGASTPLVALRATDMDAYVSRRLRMSVSAKKVTEGATKATKGTSRTVSSHTIAKEVKTLATALRISKRKGLYRGDIEALMPVVKQHYSPRTRYLSP